VTLTETTDEINVVTKVADGVAVLEARLLVNVESIGELKRELSIEDTIIDLEISVELGTTGDGVCVNCNEIDAITEVTAENSEVAENRLMDEETTGRMGETEADESSPRDDIGVVVEKPRGRELWLSIEEKEARDDAVVGGALVEAAVVKTTVLLRGADEVYVELETDGTVLLLSVMLL
jgi:hypothetical protein